MNGLPATIRRFLSDETGISSVEYALLLAFVGGAIIVAGDDLGDAVADEFNFVAGCLNASTASAGC